MHRDMHESRRVIGDLRGVRPGRRAAIAGLVLVAALSTATTAVASGRGARVRAGSSRERAHAPTAGAARAAGSAAAKPSRAVGGFTNAIVSGNPLAVTANVNSTIPAFTFFLVFHPVSSSKVDLKAFQIQPFSPRHDLSPTGGCRFCTGKGHFLTPHVRGSKLTEKVKGNIYLTARTRFSEAVQRPGEIGRYKQLGVSFFPSPRPFLVSSGCLAADALLGNTALLHPHGLPVVPCKQSVPFDSTKNFVFSAPAELSPTTAQDASISGSVSGKRWLALYKDHSKCGADSQAEVGSHRAPGLVWHLKRGHFDVGFKSGTDTTPGYYCVYVQTGGKWHGAPDGRVTITGVFRYYAGDTLSITGANSVAAPGDTVTNTFAGNASTSETLWTFDAYQPCATTPLAEYTPAIGFGDTPVSGAYSQSINSVPLPNPGTVYRCAYLQLGSPSGSGVNAMPTTAPTLASASYTVTVP
jgi:hypothetical protein